MLDDMVAWKLQEQVYVFGGRPVPSSVFWWKRQLKRESKESRMLGENNKLHYRIIDMEQLVFISEFYCFC